MSHPRADMRTIEAASGSVTAPTRVRYWVLGAACGLAIITYLHRAGFQSISTELLADLKMDSRHLWAMTVAFMIAYGLFEVPWGRLGDKVGARGLLTAVVVGGSLMTAALAIVVFLPQLMALQLAFVVTVRFLFGAFQAGTFPILSRVMADWMPATERGKAQGLVWMATRAGGALAPMVIVPLFQSMGNWQAPLIVGAFIGLLWCVCVIPWFRNRPEESPRVNEAEVQFIQAGRRDRKAITHARAPWRTMLRSSNVWALWMMYGFLGFSGNFFLFQYTNYLETRRGFDKTTSMWLTVAPFAFGVFACVTGGALSDLLMKRLRNPRLGRRVVGFAGLLFAGTMIAITPWVQHAWVLGLLYGLTFLGNDLSMGPAWAAASDIGLRHAGSVAGVMNMMASLMAALAAVMTGQAFHAAGQAAVRGDLSTQNVFMALPFCVFAISYLLGALCWLRVDVTDPVPQD